MEWAQDRELGGALLHHFRGHYRVYDVLDIQYFMGGLPVGVGHNSCSLGLVWPCFL